MQVSVVCLQCVCNECSVCVGERVLCVVCGLHVVCMQGNVSG